MTRILILCTGNSCRSQMAEGFLHSLDPALDVHSAGTHPATQVHPFAIAAMKEAGIDMSSAITKHVDQFVGQSFDFVVTVCDDAREACPVFSGKVRTRHHMGFDDPGLATGTEEHIKGEFRRVRDEIRDRLSSWYDANLSLNS